jgi:hypothetical protein
MNNPGWDMSSAWTWHGACGGFLRLFDPISGSCPGVEVMTRAQSILSLRFELGRLVALMCGAVVMAAVMLTSIPCHARVVVPEDDAPPAIRVLLDDISRAFRTGNHEDLVSYLHPVGVQVGLSPQADRAGIMTPAQAHYYFKNLFQLRLTVRFNFLKHHQSGQDRFLAMAVWHWENADGGQPGHQRLLFALVQVEGHWRVAEITALRGG